MIENGVGTVVVTGTATWAEDDTFVVAVPETTILGYTVSGDDITVTCTA